MFFDCINGKKIVIFASVPILLCIFTAINSSNYVEQSTINDAQ